MPDEDETRPRHYRLPGDGALSIPSHVETRGRTDVDRTRAEAIVEAVGSMDYGSHCCFVSADDDLTGLAVRTYVRSGLAAGDQVMCVSGRWERPWLEGALSGGQSGIPLDRHLADGSLILFDMSETPMWPGEFTPQVASGILLGAIDGALAAGFHGFRVCSDMTWGRRHFVGHEDLVEMEHLIEAGIATRQAMGLCVYDPREFTSVEIEARERAHSIHAGTGPDPTPSLRAERVPDGVRLIGEADLTTCDLLDSALREAAARTSQDVVVDLSGLTFVDVSALETIAAAADRLRSRRRLIVRAMPSSARTVVELLGWGADNAGSLIVDGPPGGAR